MGGYPTHRTPHRGSGRRNFRVRRGPTPMREGLYGPRSRADPNWRATCHRARVEPAAGDRSPKQGLAKGFKTGLTDPELSPGFSSTSASGVTRRSGLDPGPSAARGPLLAVLPFDD